MKLGQVDISEIFIDPRHRDEIPQLLIGLQHVYRNPELKGKVFGILEEMAAARVDTGNGRPGMDLWRILVLGMLRLICGWDYDKLKFMVETNLLIRQFLGEPCDGPLVPYATRYPLQTLKDNVSILTPEALSRISEVMIGAGHAVVKKKEEELLGKCDSYVLETDVHFPTDLSLLLDAVRKTVDLASDIAADLGVPGWRQSAHNVEKAKRLFDKARRTKHRKGKDSEEKFKEVCAEYIAHAEEMVVRALSTLSQVQPGSIHEAKANEAARFGAHAMLQIDQMRRRLSGETIPHDEKVFSVFEEHTEWISKGKAGKPQELGVRVCILQDQFSFILHHKVMWKLTDEKVTVEMVERAKALFQALNGCSFDKGFYSPDVEAKLMKIIANVILPRKGKLTAAELERERSPEFVAGRKAHPAIESAINALENHGLDRCPDHGAEALERYVALGVLARNTQILGKILATKTLSEMKGIKGGGRRKFPLAA